MTTLQLLQRVARRSRTGDFTKLGQTEQMDVLQSANAAMQRAYNALPAYLKEITQGFVLPGPLAITGVGVTQFSASVPTNTFDVSQIGRTVVLDGDPQWNQVLDPSTLQNPYMGASGTVNGTVYGNAVYSTTTPFDRIIGNPLFADQSMAPLIPMEMSRSEGPWNWLFQQGIGRPMTWGVKMLGNSQGKSPFLVMRFAPAPDKAYAINVRLSFWPKRLLLSDIQAASPLPIPDHILETGLIPMAIQELMSTPIWNSISIQDDNRMDDRGKAAEQFCRDQVADPAAPNNKIYCPLGF